MQSGLIASALFKESRVIPRIVLCDLCYVQDAKVHKYLHKSENLKPEKPLYIVLGDTWFHYLQHSMHSTSGRHALDPCVWAANMLISLAYVRVETSIALIPSMLQPCLSKSWANANIILLCLWGWLSVVAGSRSLTSVGEASDLQHKHFARQSAGFGSGFIHWSLGCYVTFTLDTSQGQVTSSLQQYEEM